MQAQSTDHITFALAVNDREIFKSNFLASPCLRGVCGVHQILVQQDFDSAAKAYNDAVEKSLNDLIVFCHQDMFFPAAWLSDLQRAIDYLQVKDPNWGVLGCSGMTCDRHHWRYLYSSGLGISGEPLAHPEPVQTLDEIVLIFRKSSRLWFDEQLPSFHLYGTDICLRAAAMGMRSYAISAFCVHNTNQNLILPKEFYICCQHIKKSWKNCLPIQTTCIRITESNFPIFLRRAQEFYLRYIRRKEVNCMRAENLSCLLEENGLREMAGTCHPSSPAAS
jgi:Glycosyltransferase like family